MLPKMKEKKEKKRKIQDEGKGFLLGRYIETMKSSTFVISFEENIFRSSSSLCSDTLRKLMLLDKVLR